VILLIKDELEEEFLENIILEGVGKEGVDYIIKKENKFTKIVELENYFIFEKEPFFLRLLKNIEKKLKEINPEEKKKFD
jgi:hypothetical protein